MRKILLAFAVTAAMVFVAPGVAPAITYGKADGDRHPEVGALVGTFGKQTYPYCSGTLVSRTVFLTAAHCKIAKKNVKVTFDEKYNARSKLYSGTFHASPLYPAATNDPHDIAVVVFDEPIRGIDPARLPARNRPGDRKRRHLLRRLRWSQLSRRRRCRDRYRRQHDHNRRRQL